MYMENVPNSVKEYALHIHEILSGKEPDTVLYDIMFTKFTEDLFEIAILTYSTKTHMYTIEIGENDGELAIWLSYALPNGAEYIKRIDPADLLKAVKEAETLRAFLGWFRNYVTS